jgi:hypothetical protein
MARRPAERTARWTIETTGWETARWRGSEELVERLLEVLGRFDDIEVSGKN